MTTPSRPPGRPASPHAWELLTEGTQRIARHPGPLLYQDRRVWTDWLRPLGVDPDDALVEPLFLVADDDTRILQYLGVVRNPDGTRQMKGAEIHRCVVTVQLQDRIPPFPGADPGSAVAADPPRRGPRWRRRQ